MTDAATKTLSIFKDLLKRKAEGEGDMSTSELAAIEIAELQLDSLEKMELIMEIEDASGLVLDEGSVLKCRTLGDLMELVKAAA
jgi:acyl carrier protein